MAVAVRIPVGAAVESGYGEDAEGVADMIRAVLAAGMSRFMNPRGSCRARERTTRRPVGSDYAELDTLMSG
jgi:hypothetical protein